MKELKCMYCGKQIRQSTEPEEHKWIHIIGGTYRCDKVYKREQGFNEAKKAQPFIFDNYLKEAEKLGSI